LELLTAAVADDVELAVRVGRADGRSVRRPFGVVDGRVPLIFDDVFVLEEAGECRNVPDANEPVVCGRQDDVGRDRVCLDDVDIVLVASKCRKKLSSVRVPDFEGEVGASSDDFAVVAGPGCSQGED
jgi:hypothetical protein